MMKDVVIRIEDSDRRKRMEKSWIFAIVSESVYLCTSMSLQIIGLKGVFLNVSFLLYFSL